MLQNRESVNLKFLLPVLFLAARFIMIMGFSLDGLKGYGDFWSYLPIAKSGIPFMELWVEYPPVFPFVSYLIQNLSASSHAYEYLLLILFSLVQSLNIYIYLLIAQKLNFSGTRIALSGISYTVLSIVLPFTWWTFDVLCLLMILMAVFFFLQQKVLWSGVAAGFGVLVKLFPILLCVLPIKYLSMRRALLFVSAALLFPVATYGILYAFSPEYSTASIVSQYNKGSWESVWALIDGNLATGNFSEYIDRHTAETAYLATGNPAKISPLLTLPLFMIIGFFSIRKLSSDPQISIIPLIGLTFCIFFLWSPGWSPQWSVYFLPLFFLGMPFNTGALAAMTFVSINLLEWPVLLSRGRFDLLWVTIITRTLLLILFSIVFFKNGLQSEAVSNHQVLQTVES